MGEFDKYLQEIGIEHYYSYPRTPKTNGNVERVIRTIEEELWFIEGIDYTIDHLNSLLEKYIEKYNFVRPHCWELKYLCVLNLNTLSNFRRFCL